MIMVRAFAICEKLTNKILMYLTTKERAERQLTYEDFKMCEIKEALIDLSEWPSVTLERFNAGADILLMPGKYNGN